MTLPTPSLYGRLHSSRVLRPRLFYNADVAGLIAIWSRVTLIKNYSVMKGTVIRSYAVQSLKLVFKAFSCTDKIVHPKFRCQCAHRA